MRTNEYGILSVSLALYRKYRSRSLDEIVGQEHVTTLLRRAIEQGKVAHAYLFTGPRGVGKTSIARILAHELNGIPYRDETAHLDIIEIDAASNNGVEDIRDLRERVQIAPVNASKKVYIIDEVHMLSKPAFNALLKTLEEPPEHVVFILATTDIDKVPETIISRTQRHAFRRASEPDIIANLKRIAKEEGATVDDEAYRLVAKHADGSFRDSVSLFDQLLSGVEGNNVEATDVTRSLGLISTDAIEGLLSAVRSADIGAIDAQLRQLETEGIPPRTTAMQLTDRLRRDLASQPEYAALLDNLLDVSKSHHPELKLLTVLSMAALPTAGGAIPTAKPMTRETPVKTTAQRASRSVASSDKPHVPPSTHANEPLADPVPKSPAPNATKNAASFDWDNLITHVRKNHVALYSVLAKCEPELDGSMLKLYTKSAFYKKKLDDPKYRQLISSSLNELGYSLETETIATAKPLKDSQAARVAAIMGGGEEVSVTDA